MKQFGLYQNTKYFMNRQYNHVNIMHVEKTKRNGKNQNELTFIMYQHGFSRNLLYECTGK